MKGIQRLSLAAALTLVFTALAPLCAYAEPDPEAIFQRGECGATTDLISESNENAIGAGKALKVVVGEGSGAGLITTVKGLRPIRLTGSGWQNLSLRIDTGDTLTREIVVLLYFDFPGRPDEVRQVTLSDFPNGSQTKAGWRTFSLNNRDLGGFGRDGLLRKLVVVVRAPQAVGVIKTVKLGKVSIFHFGQGNIEFAAFKLRPADFCPFIR